MTHGGSPVAAPSHGGGAPSGFTRFIATVQIVASLLAVPLGIASFYSIYRANFSAETACQSLRANIVTMLDKNVAAAARRMLVRRDVEAFEKTCGGVDPDAEAAFKALLAADKPAAPVAAVARAVEPPAAAAHKVDKVDLRPSVTVAFKQPPVRAEAAAAMEPAERDGASNDARWLAAVRDALVTHNTDRGSARAVASAPATPTAPAPTFLRVPQPDNAAAKKAPLPVAPLAQPTAPLAQPAAPPASVARAPAFDAGHPVPPAPIPDMTQPPAPFAQPPAQGSVQGSAQAPPRSRLGELVAQIPIVGWAFDR